MALASYIAYARTDNLGNKFGDVNEIITGATAQEVVDGIRDRRSLYGEVIITNVGYDAQSLWYAYLEYKVPNP